VPIDTTIPFSDGWWLNRLYTQLRRQQEDSNLLWNRYIGDPPLPPMSPNQREAVKWFVGKARSNFERLIVNAVLSRLRIRGIRTAVDPDEGGDAEAFQQWKRTRGKLWSLEVHKLALTMRRAYVMVGRHPETDALLVTAEDPRHCTVIVDPADPLKVRAGLKLIYDPTSEEDVAFLLLPGAVRVAKRNRSQYMPLVGGQFHSQAFDWSEEDFLDPAWLKESGDFPAVCPIVEFVNEDGMAEFEPHIEILDRITQQVLQRMTVASIQAFKQRGFKGLPQNDPKTGEKIDYNEIFVAEPGAIWNIPAAVDIWESGEADMQGIILSIRDDIKDLAAVSGTPLYSITPDAANGSAEGASLQRETLTFKVEARQDRWELSHEAVAELIFRTVGDTARAQPGTIEIMWAPADRPSMSERANAIAQTKGVMPRYLQLTEVWGMDPAQADRAMSQLSQDMILDQAMAAAQGGQRAASAAAGGANGAAAAPTTRGNLAPRQTGPVTANGV
jgi:hypothetical protein